jgi:regulator of protease activity HflC (stomatin/prohibitin superfamily)
MEKIRKPISGYLALLLAILAILAIPYSAITLSNGEEPPPLVFLVAALLLFTAIFLFKGLAVIQPNYSVVLTFFGKYVGTYQG